MKIKTSIIFLVAAVIAIFAGGIYVYYKAIPPKGKATGVLEVAKAELKEIDKIFKLADINNDKLAEIILLKKLEGGIGNIFILDEKGNLFDGWPKDGKNPAIGDVNNDGYKEIIDIVNDSIHIYDQFGEELSGFPFALENKSITYPILSDLDKDGFLEVIWGSNTKKPAVNVIRGDAFIQSGWPKELFTPSGITLKESGSPLSIATGDINGDEDVEIAVFSLKRIFVFNSRGELISRTEALPFPEDIKDDNQKMMLVDFDLDKEPEAVLLYGNEVSVRKINGEILNKIDIKMEDNISSLIAGDLNGDDLPEIVLAMPDRKIYAYSNAGILLTGWPIDNAIGNPVIGDINSEGINELIIIRKPYDKYEIAAYDISGKPANGWPISLDYAINSTLALCDIDDDRLIEIVFADTKDNIRIIKTAGIVSTGTYPEDNGNSYNDGVWENKYMLIDRERGIISKNKIISEALGIIPEFMKPEFKLLVPGKELPYKQITEKKPEEGEYAPVEKPGIVPEAGKIGIEAGEGVQSDVIKIEVEKLKNMNGITAQDWQALGRIVDKFKVAAYDYSDANTEAGPIAPLEWISDLNNFALTKVEPGKLIIDIPFYGYDWVGTNGASKTWLQVQDIITANNITAEWNSIAGEPYFNYPDENANSHTVYYENAESIKYKSALFYKAGIKGISICQIGSEDPNNWQIINELRKTEKELNEYEIKNEVAGGKLENKN